METQEKMMDAKCISLNGVSHEAEKEKFCQLWPSAKQALEHLRDMVKNPVVKSIVATVMKAGDTVSSVSCSIG